MPTPLDPIIDRLAKGETIRAICADLGIEHSSIYRRLKKKGLVLPKQGWSSTLHLPNDPFVLGYIAGIIDGEGCISHTTKGYWHVRVAMTDEPVIRWLAQFGGNVQFEDRSHLLNRKNCWTWNVSRHRDVTTLLTAISPILIVKKERAQECLTALHP